MLYEVYVSESHWKYRCIPSLFFPPPPPQISESPNPYIYSCDSQESPVGTFEFIVFECLSSSFCEFFFGVFVFVFLGPRMWHVKVCRLGVESELQLLAYTRAMATPDPSHICDLCHSSWQCWVLNPLSEARDQICVFMDISRVPFC